MTNNINELRAKIAEMERQEPVAEIGQQYTLLFAGSGSITGVVKRHGLKIGDKLYALPGAQPAPSVPKLHVGNLPTVNQDDYPALGAWWVQLWDGDNVFARVYGASSATLERIHRKDSGKTLRTRLHERLKFGFLPDTPTVVRWSNDGIDTCVATGK